jgi:hypothetical protein
MKNCFVSTLFLVISLFQISNFSNVGAFKDYGRVYDEAVRGQDGWKENQELPIAIAQKFLSLRRSDVELELLQLYQQHTGNCRTVATGLAWLFDKESIENYILTVDYSDGESSNVMSHSLNIYKDKNGIWNVADFSNGNKLFGLPLFYYVQYVIYDIFIVELRGKFYEAVDLGDFILEFKKVLWEFSCYRVGEVWNKNRFFSYCSCST